MVKNFANINKTNKESLNSDGHQFPQYQQNKQGNLKLRWSAISPISTKQGKFKQRWSTILPISTKQTRKD